MNKTAIGPTASGGSFIADLGHCSGKEEQLPGALVEQIDARSELRRGEEAIPARNELHTAGLRSTWTDERMILSPSSSLEDIYMESATQFKRRYAAAAQ